MADLPAPRRLVVDAGARFRLSVYGVGLACCAVELVAATVRSAGDPPDPGTPEIEVMVVAGTVTDRMAPALLALYDAMPEPRAVLSFGACSNTGGPYWDSYAVTKGVDQLLPVDVYVPGCPPRPEALLEGLERLGQRLAAR
ncbi:MAG TPA: NADH-quinone oxidoreductase subunit NuoB [Mycobacteriales bacterium]|jgi:NADH-quinone oxidoreductase subunit B|nr:NADH-quinone oxidoreductase subunit NuoB [Mycobacteriales bacterium]